MENTEPTESELPIYGEDGVDLTLIRWMLTLSIDDRLANLESQAAFLQEARDALSAVSVSRNS